MDFPETRWSLIGRLADQPDQVAVVLELYADPIGRYLRGKFVSDATSARLDDVIQEVLMYLMEHPDLLSRAHPGEIAAGQASRNSEGEGRLSQAGHTHCVRSDWADRCQAPH